MHLLDIFSIYVSKIYLRGTFGFYVSKRDDLKYLHDIFEYMCQTKSAIPDG